MNSYISDILSQPVALKRVLDSFAPESVLTLSKKIHEGEFDRIVITAMGASYNAAYPAYLQLSQLAIPVMLVNAAELGHYARSLISPRTLLWMNSQSGRSAEIVSLLDHIQAAPPAGMIAFTNDDSSPLASAADYHQHIHAGAENMVSTKTYINMLALNSLVALSLSAGDVWKALKELLAASEAMRVYLEDWRSHLSELDNRLGEFDDLILLGRGVSMSTVWNGALINKEAAKWALEGMNSADFRHGPLELIEPGFVALVLAGAPETAKLNRNLALEITNLGGRALWLDSTPDDELPSVLIPQTSQLALPLIEILPLQLLSLLLASRKGIQAGQFRYISKITTQE